MENSRHTINLDNRERLTTTGVTDILSFDEENIVAQTEREILIIRGQNLRIHSFDDNKGSLVVEGNVSSITYDNEPEARGGLWSKLFK